MSEAFDKVNETRAAKVAEYDSLIAGDFTADAQTRADALKAQIKALDERATELKDAEEREAAALRDAPKPAYDKVTRVTKEERTYTREKDIRGDLSLFETYCSG